MQTRRVVMEDSSLYWLMLVVGAIPVSIAIARHGVFGVQATVGAMLVVFAARALALIAVNRWRSRR